MIGRGISGKLINTLEQSIYSAGEKPTLFSKDLPLKIRVETSHKAAEKKARNLKFFAQYQDIRLPAFAGV